MNHLTKRKYQKRLLNVYGKKEIFCERGKQANQCGVLSESQTHGGGGDGSDDLIVFIHLGEARCTS